MKRSKHSLSHYKLLTCNMGELVPIACFEVLPGDSIQQATSLLLRTSPLLSPVMHPVSVRIHHWFVPNRLIWTNWESFITGGLDGLDATVHPYVDVPGGGYAVGSIMDYLGIPTTVGDTQHISALPMRAYNTIWNEWYRDQDLASAVTVSKGDGADATTAIGLKNVAWEKDYFTTARLYTQKGASVTLPIGTSADVDLKSTATNPGQIRHASTHAQGDSGNVTVNASGYITDGNADNGVYDPNGTLVADLSTATAATINELREALALQRYEEARARYGARYTEYLRYLGVRSSDARLQRPEYLGGGRQTIQFSEVLQTGVTTSGTPSTGVGSMLGHGIGAVRSNRYRRFFEEHGLVLSLLSVLPRTMYVNGVDKMWLRTTKEDYFQKELQHIGQEEIQNKEVYMAHASPTGTFGYQDRYDTYRRLKSTVSGDFRTTLNYWHMARIFSSDPALNETFIGANPTTRIYQSTSTDQLYIMANHSIQARRLVSKIGTSSAL